jgi:hypothetical protein
MGAPAVSHPFPIFKETETNKNCCGCGNNQFPISGGDRVGENSQVVVDNKALYTTRPSTTIVNNGERIFKIEKTAQLEITPPQTIGTSQYSNRGYPNVPEFQRDSRMLNLNLIHNDKK